jgi:hypothetical protein
MTQCPKCKYDRKPIHGLASLFEEPTGWTGDEDFTNIGLECRMDVVIAQKCPKCACLFLQTNTKMYLLEESK